jgi:hypothetical protein
MHEACVIKGIYALVFVRRIGPRAKRVRRGFSLAACVHAAKRTIAPRHSPSRK